ncbi:FmdE family protein [Heliomicrobium modesticaldum]|nr:FmdE family protein [Heliomicrobium modesticaldum]
MNLQQDNQQDNQVDTRNWQEQERWQQCVRFHGHACPGLAIGFRQALIAMEALKVKRDGDEELFAVIETDACGADAVQWLTGCTIGKGNLIYRDRGKHALTLADRKSCQAVRVVTLPGESHRDRRSAELRAKVMAGEATPEERSEWSRLQQARMNDLLRMPVEALFRITAVPMPPVQKARLFNTVVCSRCGEPLAESRARLADGKPVCLDCHPDYSRGW